jgi:hypothetical protein
MIEPNTSNSTSLTIIINAVLVILKYDGASEIIGAVAKAAKNVTIDSQPVYTIIVCMFYLPNVRDQPRDEWRSQTEKRLQSRCAVAFG